MRSKRTPLVIGLVGIAIEATAIALFVSGRIGKPIGIPLVVAGMLLAFVPIFVLARRARQRR